MLLTEPMDSFMLMGLHKYKDFELKNVAQAEIENIEKPQEQNEAEKIPDADFNYPVDTSNKSSANGSPMYAPATDFRNRWRGWWILMERSTPNSARVSLSWQGI